MKLIGGRAIHPVSMRVGGFSQTPSQGPDRGPARAADRGAGPLAGDAEARRRLQGARVRARPALRRHQAPDRVRPQRGPDRLDRRHRRAAVGLARRLPRGAARRHERPPRPNDSTAGRTCSGRRRASPSTPTSSTRWPRRRCEASGLAEQIARNPYWSIAARSVELIHASACGAGHRQLLRGTGPAVHAVDATRRRDGLGHRGAARHLLAPLRRGRERAGSPPPRSSPPPARTRA